VRRGGFLVGRFDRGRVPRDGEGGLVLRLPDPPPVRGRVLDALTGRPIAGVLVGPWADRSPLGLLTDGEGWFELPGLPPGGGEESLHFVGEGHEGRQTTCRDEDAGVEGAARLVPLARVTLRAIGGDGRPVPRAEGLVFLLAGRTIDSCRETADEHGRLEMHIRGSDEVEDLCVIAGDLRSEEVEIRPEAGKTTEIGDVVRRPVRDGPTPTVRVVDPAGEPLPGAFRLPGSRPAASVRTPWPRRTPVIVEERGGKTMVRVQTSCPTVAC